MTCISPGATTPEELMACADGDCSPEVSRHLERCAFCTAEVAAYARAQKRLRRVLFRLECPPPETLADYELGRVSAEERVAFARHVVECPRCREELETLRRFMADQPPATARPGLRERFRRVLAAPLAAPLRPALATLRGADEGGLPTFSADGFRIKLTLNVEAGASRTTVIGLVWHNEDPAADVAGEARLVADSAVAQTTPIDELGNFTFESVASGTYTLELNFADLTSVIEDLKIGA